MRCWWIWLGGLGLAACQLDSSGVGSSGGSLVEENDDPAGDETSADPADPADGSAGLGGQAQLSLSTDLYRFDRLLPGEEAHATLTVRNMGEAEASGLTGSPLPAPFGYTGGRFPGTAGDCAPSLPAGASCTVEVFFGPTAAGNFEAPLRITHDDGPEATGTLEGQAGESDNLLVNPGGEDLGSPPPGWMVTGPGTWVAGDPFDVPDPLEGSSYLGANEGPNDQIFRLRQDVAVDRWAALIDQGIVRVRFEGHARSYQEGDDDYRLTVQYIDGDEAFGNWNSDWQTSTSWQFYSDDRIVPAGTRTVRVLLSCNKGRGEICDAFFDQLSLRVTAP
ncbi:MAG: hypothetical protein AAGF11_30545 [Myxococcota bacterium]